jgi:hypothetical protein
MPRVVTTIVLRLFERYAARFKTSLVNRFSLGTALH